MIRSGLLLVHVSVVIVLASLASNVYAACTTCGGVGDWTASANNFLEGKPINDIPPSLTPPQLARMGNTEFNSSLLNEKTGATGGQNNLSATPTLDTMNVSNSTNVTSNSTNTSTGKLSDLWSWGNLPVGYTRMGNQIIPIIPDQSDNESIMETPSQLVSDNNVKSVGGMLVRPK